MAQALAYLLVGCWESSCQKQGEGRVSCTYTLCLPGFECCCFCVIDCVSGYVSALLNLAGGFCCWHGTLLEWSMPRACVEGQSPSQGVGQRTSGRLNCLWVNAGIFLGIRSDKYTNVNYIHLRPYTFSLFNLIMA